MKDLSKTGHLYGNKRQSRRWNDCTRKKAFKDKRAAIRAIKASAIGCLGWYKCRWCQQYHVYRRRKASNQ